jgi:hypothetical protein
MRRRGSLRWGVAALLWGLMGPSPAAETTVQMVIETCERALAAGYRDLDAAMCDWHVRPCGVCGEAPAAWCLPPALNAAKLAAEVVATLKQDADPAQPAQPQVERILRAHYPCAAQDGPRN